jgi:hypothetical protein
MRWGTPRLEHPMVITFKILNTAALDSVNTTELTTGTGRMRMWCPPRNCQQLLAQPRMTLPQQDAQHICLWCTQGAMNSMSLACF